MARHVSSPHSSCTWSGCAISTRRIFAPVTAPSTWNALSRKYPNASRSWPWQYVFPSRTLSTDPRSGEVRRHHTAGSTVQKAVARAVQRASLSKRASCHTFRHSFATHLLEAGYGTFTVQELLGHVDVRTIRTETHVLDRGGHGVQSPLDRD